MLSYPSVSLRVAKQRAYAQWVGEPPRHPGLNVSSAALIKNLPVPDQRVSGRPMLTAVNTRTGSSRVRGYITGLGR